MIERNTFLDLVVTVIVLAIRWAFYTLALFASVIAVALFAGAIVHAFRWFI